MNFNKNIKIADYHISEESEIFIIAEAGVNHNGDLETAKRMVDVAKEANANAIKFQSYKTKNLIKENVEKAPYQKVTTKSEESQYEMLKRLEISQDFTHELIKYCNFKKILFLSTPYDVESLEELEQLDLPAYKVASTDTTNLLFLEKIAQTGKPIILSTGMTFLSEIEIALQEIYPINKNVILLHCTSNYPTADDEVNLSVINTFKEKFDVLIGFSDHTTGLGASPFTVPMGVCVLEKHFTLDKESTGPDHKASLSPEELQEYVKIIRKVEKYLGKPVKVPTIAEQKNRLLMQKYLVASSEIKKGEVIIKEKITAKRTGGVGISPIYYKSIIGKRACKDFSINDVIEI